eukprot:scaffold258561_cov19-Tisochrysis_lutea.AAC.1
MHTCIQAWVLRSCGVGLTAVAGAVYAFSFVRTAKPGMRRLLRALPVLLLHCLLPLLFDHQNELISRASAAAMLTWLGNFKVDEVLMPYFTGIPPILKLSSFLAQVLLLCMGRGPLSDTSLRKGQFAALALWPVLHVEGGSASFG